MKRHHKQHSTINLSCVSGSHGFCAQLLSFEIYEQHKLGSASKGIKGINNTHLIGVPAHENHQSCSEGHALVALYDTSAFFFLGEAFQAFASEFPSCSPQQNRSLAISHAIAGGKIAVSCEQPVMSLQYSLSK